MDDAPCVRRLERVGDREADLHELRGRERSPRQALLQRLALEQFHRDERRIAGDVVDRADVGVIECRCARASR